MRNNWYAKLRRTSTCVLPISKRRQGSCVRCGECCKLPNRCRFLAYDSKGKSYCKVYRFRTLNCRKYPRSEAEFITQGTCGFGFRKR